MGENCYKKFYQLPSGVAWLVFLYGLCLYLAVGTLGVSQIGDSKLGNVIVSVEAELARRDTQDKELARIEAEIEKLKDARKGAEARIRRQIGKAALTPDEAKSLLDTLYLADGKIAATLTTEAESKSWYEDVAAMTEIDRELPRLIVKAIDLRTQIAAVKVGDDRKTGSAEADDQRVVAAVRAMVGLRYFWLAKLPKEVLTLLLATAMGMLGATLRVTRVFLDAEESRPFSWYVFRPIQGAVTAIAVFVLMKAGQITISAESGDTLNPFFVAFVGIVSGMLCEQAYQAIQKAGDALLPAVVKEDKRWAFRLDEFMKAGNHSIPDMARTLGLTEAQIVDWIGEKEAVPSEQQRLIASYLRLPARAIFTSEAP